MSKHPSGILPTEFKVLIEPETVEEKTKGGIILPDETKERDQFAQMKGTLVAVSPLAFTYADWASEDDKPKPGDKVLFAKYAGAKVTGMDGREYRLANDKDVAAVLS
jgi:chaperonin GroES